MTNSAVKISALFCVNLVNENLRFQDLHKKCSKYWIGNSVVDRLVILSKYEPKTLRIVFDGQR